MALRSSLRCKKIVLPCALPPASIALALALSLANYAPHFYKWLSIGRAQTMPFSSEEHGCTPFEGWQVRQAGFEPLAGPTLGTGLGPLWMANSHSKDLLTSAVEDNGCLSEPVWLVELVNIEISTQQATLTAAEDLEISPADSHALFTSAQAYFVEAGYRIEPISPQKWRVYLPENFQLRSVSPAVVEGQALHTWWQTDKAVQPWRQLLNHIQMAWHDAPVNITRSQHGLLPINSLWLYGGAKPWTICEDSQTHIIKDLEVSYRHYNWSNWLEAWAQIDLQYFKPLSLSNGLPCQPIELLLFGTDRSVQLTVKPRSALLQWFAFPQSNWKNWWSPPV